LQFLGLLRCLASCKAAGSIFDLLVGELDLVQLGKSILEEIFDLLKIFRERVLVLLFFFIFRLVLLGILLLFDEGSNALLIV
jgi:hypothetical protein